MNKKLLLKKTILVSAMSLASMQVLSAGFQLNAQSATGLGRAFAGDAVIADNASSMSRNPATMALFDEISLSLGLVSITSDVSLTNATYSGNVPAPFSTSADYSDAGGTSFAPNLHLIVPLNEKFAVGLNLYSNFGTKTEFDSSYVATAFGEMTDVKSFNAGTSLSYRINTQWSIGAGLDLVYGQGKMKRTLGAVNALELDTSGFGVGFNVGTVYELDKNNRFGLSYRKSPKLKTSGDVTYMGTLYKDDNVYMPLPDIAEFSGFHKVAPQFAVHYSVQWIGWSSFDALKADAAPLNSQYQWQNAFHYSIGGTYYLNNKWTLRTGYMYDTSAQNEITSISVPDSDRQWFSAGFTYKLDEKSNIDFGATYLLGQDVDVKEEIDLGAGAKLNVEGVTHANAIILGLQYSRTF